MQIDHLVFAGPDLDALVARVAHRFGVDPQAGGQHLGRGTRNQLVGLGRGVYLELIGPDPDQPSPPQPRPFGIDDLTAPALVAWAIRCEDIDLAVREAQDVGLDPGAVESMQRATPSGERLAWRLTTPYAGTTPFFIDWGSTRHPSEALRNDLRLVQLRLETPCPEPLAGALDRLGIDVIVGAGEHERVVATIDAGGSRSHLT